MDKQNKGTPFSNSGDPSSSQLNKKILEKIENGEIDATSTASRIKKERKPTRRDITEPFEFEVSSKKVPSRKKENKTSESGIYSSIRKYGIVFIIFMILLITLLVLSFSRVAPGEAGVQHDRINGGYESTIWSGMKFHGPFSDIVTYPIRPTEAEPLTVRTNTANGRLLTLTVDYSYSISEEDIGEARRLYSNQPASEIEETIIIPLIKYELSYVAGNYDDFSTFSSNRNRITSEIEESISKDMKEKNIILHNLSIQVIP